MTTEGKGPIVIPCYLVDGVPYVLEVDANGKLAVRAAEIETLLAGGLPAALDTGALKVREQVPISGFGTSAKQDTMITALQLIDDLRAALLLVGTDRLGVRATEIEALLSAPPGTVIQQRGSVAVATGAGWVTIVSYTVTTGKTLYIYSVFVVDDTGVAQASVALGLIIDGAAYHDGSAPALTSYHAEFTYPHKALSTKVVVVRGRHGAADSRTLVGGFLGYEI